MQKFKIPLKSVKFRFLWILILSLLACQKTCFQCLERLFFHFRKAIFGLPSKMIWTRGSRWTLSDLIQRFIDQMKLLNHACPCHCHVLSILYYTSFLRDCACSSHSPISCQPKTPGWQLSICWRKHSRLPDYVSSPLVNVVRLTS